MHPSQEADRRACKLTNMTSVSRSIAEHRLNIREGCQPIRQKRRGQASKMNKAIQEEVTKLMEAEIMREVHYHDWLSNPIMESKSVHKKRSGDEATITPNIERSSKPKRKAGELKQILIQIRGKVTPLLQNPQKGWQVARSFDGKGITAQVQFNFVTKSCHAKPP
ncbi:hypothetical protein Tco_0822838 [Tanacetum coccineum]|uniref:Reverse transcriptase domain-containing protein n=1 Tax=Tanacetum coccineum TaxID=301880 RepID=A0ABQ5AI14_9ASTR